MFRFLTPLAVALCVIALPTNARAVSSSPQAIITDLYRLNAEGINTKNLPAEMLLWSKSVTISGAGLKKTARYRDEEKGAEVLAQSVEPHGYRVLSSARIKILSMSVKSNTASVVQRNSIEYFIQDAAMNTVGAVTDSLARDSWVKTSAGWRIVHQQILASKQTPHTYAIGLNNALIDGMHRQNLMMKNFGDSVNQSYCMHSPAVSHLGYSQQLAVCHR